MTTSGINHHGQNGKSRVDQPEHTALISLDAGGGIRISHEFPGGVNMPSSLLILSPGLSDVPGEYEINGEGLGE